MLSSRQPVSVERSVYARIAPIIVLAALAVWLTPTVAQAEDAAAQAEQVVPERDGAFVVGASFNVGIADQFELGRENDDGEREETEVAASPTLGFTLAVDYKLSDYIGVGLEALLTWVIPEEADERRLFSHPHARIRFIFPVTDGWAVEAGLAAGAAIWSEGAEPDDNELDESRIGFSMRIGFGLVWALADLFALQAGVGYATSITPGDEVTARYGTVLFDVGGRLGF